MLLSKVRDRIATEILVTHAKKNGQWQMTCSRPPAWEFGMGVSKSSP